MANYATLKAAIQQVVKTNGNNEITGSLLQQSLLAMINSLGEKYQFAGIANPDTDPGTPDQNVFYLASESGTYSNFGGLAVSDGEVAIFKYNGTWTKEVTGAATAAQVTQLRSEVDEEISQLGQTVDDITFDKTSNLWERGDIDFTGYIIIGTQGTKLYDAGNYVLSFDYAGTATVNLIVYGPNGSLLGTRFSGAGRKSFAITANEQIERFFFQSTGNTISLTNVQLELGTVATPYVPPVTVSDITARLSLVSHQDVQTLSESAKARALNNIGALGYIGSIKAGVSLDDTSIKTGFYYLGSFSVTGRAGFLIVYNYSSTFIVQQVVDFYYGKLFTRSYGSGIWKGWVEQKDFYSFYKKALVGTDDIDDLFTEGAYYCVSGTPLGAFPGNSIGKTCLLVIEGLVNFTSQTLLILNDNSTYKRSYIGGSWSDWVHIADNREIGQESPNLLNNTKSSKTQNGITFTVNTDKSVTLSGTATAHAALSLPCTLKKGKYILTGMPNNSTWGSWFYLFTRGDNEHFNPNWKNITYQYFPEGYVFEVLNETETVNAYIRVDSGNTIPEGTVFKPMIQKYPYRSRDYVPFGDVQKRKPIYDLIDCTDFNWSGKKINVIGDSIVQGVFGNWVNHIAAILGLSDARNYGIGGCRLAYYGDGQSVTADDSVVARYASMDNDADIVIVHAGTNDWASQVPLGNADSTNQLEFNGALNIIMSGLRTKYPTALVIFDAIMERVDYDAPTHGGSPMPILTSQYSECIKERCDAHHFLFFDSYKELGLDFTQDYTSGVRATTNDGLHPNMGGAKIIGRKLAAFIKGH